MNYVVPLLLSIISCNLNGLDSLNNGLALSPPMGWSTWLALGCKPCYADKTNCLSEAAIQMTAQQLVEQGFSEAGYEYIIIDDCWQSAFRDEQGQLVADIERFPNGISPVAKYVHDRNLKLGIFSDLGERAGSNNPGTAGNHETDVVTFNSWGIDYIKMSAYTANPTFLEAEYKNFQQLLRNTNQAILYAVSSPVYIEGNGIPVNYQTVSTYSNTWRFADDAVPDWECILRIMDTYTVKQKKLTKAVHAGAWSDADLLLLGIDGITLDQGKAQMAILAIIASPLIFSADIRTLSFDEKEVLLNKQVIAINQDKLAIPGYKFGTTRDGAIDIWLRQISPIVGRYYSYAIAFISRNPNAGVINYNVTLQNLGLLNPSGYNVTDLFPHPTLSVYKRTTIYPSSTIQMQINPSGVAFFKAEAMSHVTKDPSTNNETIVPTDR